MSDDRLTWGFQIHRNPSVTYDELEEDVTRWKSIRRQLNLYRTGSKNFNERLLMNHIIIWFNTFGGQDAVEYLFSGLDAEEVSYLIPFLDYIKIDRMGDVRPGDPEISQILKDM